MRIECQQCGWVGEYSDLIAPTSDIEPSCPNCLSSDFLDVENMKEDESDPFTRMKKMFEEGIASLNGVIKTLEKLKEGKHE